MCGNSPNVVNIGNDHISYYSGILIVININVKNGNSRERLNIFKFEESFSRYCDYCV